MKNISLIIFFLSIILIAVYFLFPESIIRDFDKFDEKKYLGTWEYRQKNSSAISGYDAEGEKLIIGKHNGEIILIYLSLEREGEHGLFYSISNPKELLINNNIIEFTIGERDLYTKRPTTLDDIDKYKEFIAGFTRDKLKLKGVTQENVITFICAPVSECPDSIMIFRRNYWN